MSESSGDDLMKFCGKYEFSARLQRKTEGNWVSEISVKIKSRSADDGKSWKPWNSWRISEITSVNEKMDL